MSDNILINNRSAVAKIAVYVQSGILSSCSMAGTSSGPLPTFGDLVQAILAGKQTNSTTICSTNNVIACGKLNDSFGLKWLENNNEVGMKTWNYSVRNGATCQEISAEIPLSQYYLNLENPLYSGKMICQSDSASDGYELREYPHTNDDQKLFLLNEWSCGSSGCSYEISVSCADILNVCESKFRRIRE